MASVVAATSISLSLGDGVELNVGPGHQYNDQDPNIAKAMKLYPGVFYPVDEAPVVPKRRG